MPAPPPPPPPPPPAEPHTGPALHAAPVNLLMADLDPSLAQTNALDHFDMDADQALLHVALSTGHHRDVGVRAAQRLQCAGGKLPEAVQASLRDKMRVEMEETTTDMLAKNAHDGELMTKALEQRKQTAPVFVCASCGERQFHRDWLKYARYGLSKLDLLRYRITGDEAIAYDTARHARIARAGQHGVVFSRYSVGAGEPYYHVLQEFVDPPGVGFESNAKEHSVLLCPPCARCVFACRCVHCALDTCSLIPLSFSYFSPRPHAALSKTGTAGVAPSSRRSGRRRATLLTCAKSWPRRCSSSTGRGDRSRLGTTVATCAVPA